MIEQTTFCDILRKIIKENGIKQSCIATKMGISSPHLCDILQKKRRLTDENRDKLKEILSLYLTPEQASTD